MKKQNILRQPTKAFGMNSGVVRKMKLIGRGAEAVVYSFEWFGIPAVIKHRIEKPYRECLLDRRLRTQRTRREVALMVKAKERCKNVLCPIVFDAQPFRIIMRRFTGRMLHTMKRLDKKWVEKAAKILAELHSANIIHGDFTPANLMVTRWKGRYLLAVIDFGLGFFSKRDEDKAVDVLTMKKALYSNWPKASLHELFIKEYAKYGDTGVVERIKKIEAMVRYAPR